MLPGDSKVTFCAPFSQIRHSGLFGAGPDPAEDPTEGLPNVTAARKRAEFPSALGETFGRSLWPGLPTIGIYTSCGAAR
jgi:hypothetical protein